MAENNFGCPEGVGLDELLKMVLDPVRCMPMVSQRGPSIRELH